MKRVLARTIASFAISSFLFAGVASAIVAETNTSSEDPYTDDSSVAVTLEGSLDENNNVNLSWTKYQGENLKWYKVVRSQDNSEAKYPMDGYIKFYEDPTQTTYTDEDVSEGTNYYRLCVITTSDLRGCSNTVTIQKDAKGDDNTSSEDPYTDDSSVAVTLEGSLDENNNVNLSWTKYQGENLKWYKVVRSQDNPEAKYPMDGYIEVYGDPNQTTYTDKSVLTGTNYYRLCVITTSDLRGCSNTVTIQKETVATIGFADVPAGHWATPYINDLAKKGIVKGRNGKYEPNSPILRAEAIKMVMYGVDLDGSSCDSTIFPDLTQGDWFCDVVTKAYNKGIIKGDNGHLYPARNITRAEAVKILLKAKGLEPPTLDKNPFNDVNFKDWYAGYIYKAFKLGYVVGVGNNLFEPNRNITRAEMAKIVSIAIK